ncbi:hypothetical protein B0H11DRAFT_2220052 [Mycena galericulata]|nr:hypothetical protein B0H11DRAFT_2220052 [Mycena galericulata]
MAMGLLRPALLADEAFVEQCLADNRTALRAAYELVAEWMIFHELPFTRANTGVYVVVDLAPFIARITDPSDSDIAKLDRFDAAMLAEVLLKPTTSMADPVALQARVHAAAPDNGDALTLCFS